MTTNQELLDNYVNQGSEDAFRELVGRYVNLVYSTALRLAGGDTHLAEDVTQTVFADLARKASILPGRVMLGGWLHRHTCFVASKLFRRERRRQLRERQAVEMNAQPDHSKENLAQMSAVLDDAINALGAEDRTAILLRFFEQQDLRSIGETLGSSENAAQKRITRALEELRGLLMRRGVVLSTGILSTTLTSHAIAAAPSGFAAGIAGTALAAAATGGGTTLTVFKLAIMNKLQVGIVSAVAVTGIIAPIAIHRQAGLRAENNALRQQIGPSSDTDNPEVHVTQVAAQEVVADHNVEFARLTSELVRLRERLAYLENPSNAARLWTDARAKAYADAYQTGLLIPEQEFTNGFPRESWVFSGYGTPKAAALSLMWAMSQGDADVLFQSYTPEALDVLLGNTPERITGTVRRNVNKAEIARIMQTGMSRIIRLAGSTQRLQEPMDGTHVVLVFTPISATGEELRPVNFSLQKVGDEWKSANKTSSPILKERPGQP